MKKCNTCNTIQELSEFHNLKSTKDGKYSKCKTCKAKYNVWSQMHQRCDDVDGKAYINYGGRGITICDEWSTYEGMKSFISDGWEKGLQIDRIDNDQGYSPENCRFTTRSVNNLNRRPYGKSKYRGICWHEANNKWRALVYIYGNQKYIGIYSSEIEAAKAYNAYIIKFNLDNQLNLGISK